MKQGTIHAAAIRNAQVRNPQKTKQAERVLTQWKGLWRETTPAGRLGDRRQREAQGVEVVTRRYEEDAERWDGLS